MNKTAIKLVGIGATIVGAAATLVSSWAGEKQQDAKIAEKVAEALAKSADKES